MSESSKTRPLLDEYGKVKDAGLAEKMAYTEKEIRNTFNKTDDRSEVDQWANQASEGAFRQETGKEYSDELREAQEDTAYKEKADQVKQEIQDEVLKAGEETKFARETIVNKEGVEENDIAMANQSSIEHDRVINNEATAAEGKIEGVVNKKFTRKDAEDLTKAALGVDVFEREDLIGEIKDEKIEAVKKDFENKIKNIDGKIKILENSHGNPGDRRLYIAREAGIDIKQLTPKEEGRQKLIILARRKAEKAGLQKVEEIANNQEIKNYDELQNRLWDNFKSAKSEFSKKCDELDKEPKDSDRRKKLIEEKRDLQAKMQMARDSVADFDNHAAKEREEKDKKRQMRNQKAPKSEPAGKPQEPKAVEPAIVIKSADNQPDSQPKQGGREEMAAAYDQRIANLRLGVNEAEESGNKNEAARLEKFARELEHEKKWRLRNADGKDQGRGENKDIKPQVQSKDAQASKDKMAEPKNYDQEWQSLREQIKQAEKDGKGAEVKRLEQEIYKLEQEQRNEKAAAGEKEREKQRVEQEKNNEAQKQNQLREVEQRIADLRVEIIAAEKADNNDKIVELENALREVQKEQRRAEGKEDKKEQPPKVKSFKTAKGSVYMYDEDGKTTRFKTATGEQLNKQDITVFVDLSPAEEDSFLVDIDSNKVYVVEELPDGKLKFVRDVSEISDPEKIYLASAKDGRWTKKKKASLTPIKGYNTFDTRQFKKDGKTYTERHLGNKVAEIEYESQQGEGEKSQEPAKEAEKKEPASAEAMAGKEKTAEEKIEKEPEYKGGYPAVIEGEKVKTEMTAEQTAKVERILKDFDLTAEDAEKIEGFKDLSYGQRLLALENLKQMTLREIQDMAQTEYRQKMEQTQEKYAKSKSWLSKVGLRAKMIGQGATKYLSIAMYKSLNSGLIKKDYEKILQNVVEGMREITKYDVEEKEGKLEIQYLSGLENLNDQEKVNVNRLNEIANELGRMPLSLEQLPMGLLKDKHTRAQKIRYEKLRAEYEQLLEGETKDGKISLGILGLLERQARLDLKKEGKDDSDREVRIKALTQAGELENIIRLNRFFVENPDVEKELKSIKSGKIFTSALKDTLTERGALFVGGFAARAIGVKAITALGVASSVGIGGVILASAAGIGGGIGGWRGWRRAEESLREMDAQARSEDFESKKLKGESRRKQKESATKKGEVAYKTITNKKGETIKVTVGIELSKEERMEKNIVNADGLVERLNMLRGQIDQTSDEIAESVAKEGREGLQTKELIAKRFELAHRLEIRLGYTRRKLDGGLVNFGKNEEQAFNQMTLIDQLNLAVSYVELHKKPAAEIKPDEPSLDSGKTKSNEDKEPLTLEQRLERFLDFKSTEISKARKWHKLKQMGKGAAYGAGFAGAGASARWFLEHYGIVGGGHIPPHDRGVPAGGGSEKSAYGVFMKDRSNNVVTKYDEYFKNHQELIKGNDNNASLEVLKNMKSDLQNTGLDSHTAENITTEFNAEMGKIGTGFHPEGTPLPGADSTGGSGGAEHIAAAGDTGKAAAETLVGAKQDVLTSAVETASKKLDSVWKMADHQLEQRGFFKGLAGSADEIAAKKTYMIDGLKDYIRAHHQDFGFKNIQDVDNLRSGQEVDFSKVFENQTKIGEALRDANSLSSPEIQSINLHDKNIAGFHKLHPNIHITSENVDQIAAGHGDALLKKVAEQAASEQAQPSSPETIIQPKSPKAPHHPMNPYEDMLRNNIEGRIKEVQRLTDETVGERLNKIFDYAFGRQGAETSTYQDIKGEIADNFLKRNLSGETDINDPFAIDSDDARRYGELQEYLKELIKENHSSPKTGETIAEFIKRSVSAAIRSDIGKLTESPADPKSELI